VLSGQRLAYYKDDKPKRQKLKDFDLTTPNTLAFVPKNEREFELHCGKFLMVLRGDTAATTSAWVGRIQSASQTRPGALPPPPSNPSGRSITRPAAATTSEGTKVAAEKKRQLVAAKIERETGTKVGNAVDLRKHPTEVGPEPIVPSYGSEHAESSTVLQSAMRGKAARKMLKKRLKMNKTRTRVVMEICSTEQSYAKSLTTLCDTLISPLRRAKSPVLDSSDVQTIFMNVEQLRGLALTFSADLQKEVLLYTARAISCLFDPFAFTYTRFILAAIVTDGSGPP
jgi:hypothetical protein